MPIVVINDESGTFCTEQKASSSLLLKSLPLDYKRPFAVVLEQD